MSSEVRDIAPEVDIALAIVRGVDQDAVRHNLAAQLRQLDDLIATGSVIYDEQSPHIQAWHAIYRRFRVNPRRLRPSFDALAKRSVKTGAMPRISPLVDAYNMVSLLHDVPVGAYDLAKLGSDIQLRESHDGEEFLAIGSSSSEALPHGQVVYSSGNTIMTSCWNHRDSEHTKVDQSSTDILFVFESVRGTGPALHEPLATLAAALNIPAGMNDVETISLVEAF